MSRIKLTDTMVEVCMKMCEGNPGAMEFALALVNRDPHLLLMCDTLGLYGEKLYMLWNDCCGRDIEQVDRVITAWQRGQLTDEQIHAHVAGGYGTPFDEIETKPLDTNAKGETHD